MSNSLVTAESVDEILRTRFQLAAFRDGQRQVIERILAGKSAAAVFPTGGGKSLCYQLPAVLLDGLTLVISPLLALMREQVDFLNSRGITAARLDSTLSADQARQVMADVRSGHTKLLYVAPERFFNERFREFIQDISIALYTIDEAHCISQWGHNFRPDYLKLARIAQQLRVGRVLALTATATPTVLDDICREFAIARQDVIQTKFYRSNLNLRFTLTDAHSRESLLLDRLRKSPRQPTLIYVTLQKTAESVAEDLQAAGFAARAYHAGLDSEIRQEIQDWFMAADDSIVVATIAFGMGIDKSNIRAIYHYNPSKSLENLAQEIGRAGRDGQPADCETLLVPSDRITLENFAYGDTPSLQAVRYFVDVLRGQPESFFISHFSLGYEADIRESVIRTFMTYLELEQWLEATAPRYEKYQFKPRATSAQILSHFDGERRQFAASVLALTVKKRVWCEISLPQAANRLRCDRLRIVRMLDYFAEQGWVELQVSGLVHGYRKLKPMPAAAELAQELHEYAMQREKGELTRLDELFALMTSAKCQHAALSAHFGQALPKPCGHCSACQGNAIGRLPEPEPARLGDSALSGLERLRKQQPELLGDARSQARFLCGLTSPRMVRARLTRDPLYGCCSSLPFGQVLEMLSSR